MLVSDKFYLSRSRMMEFLEYLTVNSGDAGAMTLYIPPGSPEIEILDMLKLGGVLFTEKEILGFTRYSKTGAVLFWGGRRKFLVLLPFPSKEKVVFHGYNIESVQKLLSTDFLIGLVLVHLGSYAVGICHGEDIISSKVGTGLVHGRQRSGGSSSKRYLRRRENQVTEFLDRVCGHAIEQFTPHEQQLDYLVYGGPHQTVLQLKNRCPFLHKFEDKVLPNIAAPSLHRSILKTVVKRLWSTCVIEWQES